MWELEIKTVKTVCLSALHWFHLLSVIWTWSVIWTSSLSAAYQDFSLFNPFLHCPGFPWVYMSRDHLISVIGSLSDHIIGIRLTGFWPWLGTKSCLCQLSQKPWPWMHISIMPTLSAENIPNLYLTCVAGGKLLFLSSICDSPLPVWLLFCLLIWYCICLCVVLCHHQTTFDFHPSTSAK